MNQLQKRRASRSTHSPPPLPSKKVAIIAARWHAPIVDCAVNAATASLAGSPQLTTRVFHVPGALEIPLLAKRLAATGEFAAIIACAFVVDGGIYRHDFVAQTVIDALMRVQLDADVPVFSAVLTPHQFQESAAHIAFFESHFAQKGREVATACVTMLETLETAV